MTSSRLRLIALWVLTLLSFAPMIGVIAASSVASTFGCRLDEGSTHPCVVLGLDLAETLYAGFVLGWLMLVTWPGMLLAVVIWAWVLARLLVRRLRRARPSA